MDKENWIFVTPAPGSRFFHPYLAAALADNAPSHVRLPLLGFAMKSGDFCAWVEKNPYLTNFWAPRQVFVLDCGKKIEQAIESLQSEMPTIQRELGARRR